MSIFLKNLKTAYEYVHFDAAHDIDESDLTTCHKPSKIITVKGAKQIGNVTSAERRQLAAMCVGFIALRNSIPSFIVFFRDHFKDMFNCALLRLSGIHIFLGWMTADTFF